jgi:Flp pilus assembly protein TadG
MLFQPHHPGRCLDRRGTVAVEFALLAPCLLLLLVGTMEMGRAFWIGSTLQYAADETSRFLMVHRDASNTEVTAYALDKLVGIDPAQVTIEVERETVDEVDFITVRTHYTFAVLSSLLPTASTLLEGRARTPLLE